MSHPNVSRIERYLDELEPRRATEVSQLAPGMVRITGRARAQHTLVAPLSDQPVIGYRLVGQAGPLDRHKVFDHTEAASFDLVDVAGAVVHVAPRAAEVLAWPPRKKWRSFESFPRDYRDVLLADPYPHRPADREVDADRWLEWVLRADDEVTVVGRARETAARDGAGGSYRSAPRGWVIGPPEPHPVLLVVGSIDGLSRSLPDETYELPLRFLVWGHRVPLRLEHERPAFE